ncbi:MAG TPA: ATP-dependent RNA helicase HrpA [Steroidobacteraceae bacterium]|nr:ATP-dependent RNA helicase HrpA [Steroidobacteraceae bacterium]
MVSTPGAYNATLLALRERLTAVRHADRPRLARELDRLFARKTPDAQAHKAAEALSKAIDDSLARIERLRSMPLKIEYDTALPIVAHREEIAKALQERQLIVVCGATGSGKTTQLPKICLEAGRGTFGLIGHTQPRRIAARAIASRVAAELGTTVGAAVGFQVRFTDRTGPDTRLKVMTDGILLRELEHDRQLRNYDTLIIDEAHERSLNIDFLLGVLKRVLPQRPDLRVVITSATIDPQRFSDFFGGAPIIEVSGRSYPVDVRYRPLIDDDEDSELSLTEGIVAAVQELDREDRGDVLVFLPGEKQIRETSEALSKARLHATEVLPLYSRLSTRDQELIFEKHGARRIVLATNVAETSLTVPGMRHVVDSGLARISRYSVRGKVQRLPIEPISQASADQRKGRAGRESPGICIRLYAQDDFALRPPFTPPEVLRTNLASVILQMAALELGEPQEFPFVDPPDTRQINDGYKLLQELKAVDEARAVTSLGRQISALPLDPRLARMLLAASHHRCVAEMLILTAFLAAQDPRERPADAQTQADQKHAAFSDPRSDFIAVLNLWKAFAEQSAALSGNQLRKWCRENFLSFIRMREWQELQRQLADIAGELELKPNQVAAEYNDLHQAILTGFLGNIGALDERREYEGARGSRFVIAPGTPLASKPPKWVVAASLTETTRLYARMVAAVEPQWIEAAAEHLVKRSYSEPHWVEERGFVAAFESTSLYGLTLSSRRRVNYGSVAPAEARQIFVREALVEGRMRLRAPFLDNNRRLRRELEQLEAKLRRRDVLVDELTMTDFYLQRLPKDVHSTATLEKWLRGSHHAQTLRMSRKDLMRRDVPEVTATSHPDKMLLAGNELPLEYVFEPGSPRDGITVTLPAPLLATATPADFANPIPGWRLETITELLRALPKAVRKAFVPVPEHAARAAAQIDVDHKDFHAAFAQWISSSSATQLTAEQLAALPIPEALRFNIRVVDLGGAVLAEGRDLLALKRGIRRVESERAIDRPDTVHRRWDFGEVPMERVVHRRGLRFTIYPTLRDHGDGVELGEAGTAADAEEALRPAILRLALLALPEQFKYARKRFADDRDIVLLGQGQNTVRPMAESLAERAFSECFLGGDAPLPRTAEQFQALLDRHRSSFGEVVDRVLNHARETLRELRNVRQKLAAIDSPAFKQVQDDARAQLKALVPADFPTGVPAVLWQHLPRYLKALARRLDKAPGNQKRDAELMARVRPAMRALEQLSSQQHSDEQHAEIQRLQWLIEELRVSLFAQDLKTAAPVSEKRIAEQLERASGRAQQAR